MKSIKTVLVMVLCALAPAMAVAQSWPVKPVKIVVSSGAGGAADILARLIAERLTSTLGQPVIIDNKPGVGGHLGAEIVARSPADGYTLLMSGSPTHSVGPHLYKNLSYDPMRDVPPVAMLAAAPNLLVVNTALAVTSVEQLVQLARSKSGELNYSSAGNGTSGHSLQGRARSGHRRSDRRYHFHFFHPPVGASPGQGRQIARARY
jgi:tripartite-type tricarboxylate transporter receptor subunit TctC